MTSAIGPSNSTPMSAAGNLAKLTPAKDLTDEEKSTVFEHLYRRLAVFRNTAELYALTESSLSSLPEAQKTRRLEDFNRDLNRWAQTFLDHAFIVCEQPGGGTGSGYGYRIQVNMSLTSSYVKVNVQSSTHMRTRPLGNYQSSHRQKTS